MLFDIVNNPFLLTLEFEIVIVLHQLDHLAPRRVKGAIRPAIFLGEECFLFGGIETFIGRFIEMPSGMKLRQRGLDDFFMARFGGANEIIDREVELLDERAPIFGESIAIFLRRFAVAKRGLLDFLAMFIEASEKENVIAQTALAAGNHIRDDLFIGMPQMWLPIEIINGGRDVE